MKLAEILLRAQYKAFDLVVRALPRLSQTLRLTDVAGSAPERMVALTAPLNHRLGMTRRLHAFYDVFLPVVATMIGQRYPEAAIIDVGANIGDTAALLRLHGCSNKIHAFEPSEKYASYFRANMARDRALFKDVTLHQALVGKGDTPLSLVEYGSTASVKLGVSVGSATALEVPVMGLSECGESDYCLVKLDTDGYDFTILENETGFLKTFHPALWFEAEIKGEVESEMAKFSRLIAFLRADYDSVIFFDNCGFPFFFVRLDHVKGELLEQILAYTFHSQRSRPTIYYFDVFALPKRMDSLLPELKSAIEEISGVPMSRS